MSSATKIVTAGFAIFSMIFGSGNIAFPFILGKNFSSEYGVVICGWLLSTVAIPIMGYYGAFIFEGDYKKYLSPIGKHATFMLMALLMAMAGPFGVMARIVNVSFGGVHVIAPHISEWIFNLVFCSTTALLAWNPGKIVQIIGAIFTPLKFGGVMAIAIGAAYFGNPFSEIPESTAPVAKCFFESFKTGFQTMDLIAAFIMGSAVYTYLKKSLPADISKKDFLRSSLLACAIGALVLAVAYICLTLVGAQYSSQLQDVPNESLFPQIAYLAMGNSASWFVAIVIAVCCLATSIALATVFTDFVYLDILKQRFISRDVCLGITCSLMFSLSLLGFDQICKMLGAILETLYPALIVFTICRIAYYYIKKGNE
ncbi:MAG: branched-chain amino acid transport system II carrier protein [Holosporales bacterium]|jgi:LIVCS family branched-chain amino acid:cation transporter|nr:branched-chain amino acid transport system II carrier protein [Holosporales bacterium]